MRHAKTLLISAIMYLGLASAAQAYDWSIQAWSNGPQDSELVYVNVPSTCSIEADCGFNAYGPGAAGSTLARVHKGSNLVLLEMYGGSTTGFRTSTVYNQPSGTYKVEVSATGTNGQAFAIVMIDW